MLKMPYSTQASWKCGWTEPSFKTFIDISKPFEHLKARLSAPAARANSYGKADSFSQAQHTLTCGNAGPQLKFECLELSYEHD